MAPAGRLICYVGVHVEAEEATQIITHFHFRHSSHGTRFNGPKGSTSSAMPGKLIYHPHTHTLLGLKSIVMK